MNRSFAFTLDEPIAARYTAHKLIPKHTVPDDTNPSYPPRVRPVINLFKPMPHSRSRKPKLLDQVRHELRVRHYSLRTDKAYVQWIRRFILFHNKRHPRQMAETEINAFLTHLAVNSLKPR